MKNPERLHIVKSKGKKYGYFNTGKRVDGTLIRIPLGRMDSEGFWDRYAAHLGRRTRAQKHIQTLDKLIDGYERDLLKSNRAASTKKTYGFYITRIRSAFRDAPAEGADAVQKKDVALFLKSIVDSGARKMALNVFRQIYDHANRAGLVEVNPTDGVKVDHESEPYEPWPETLVEKALVCDDPFIRLTVGLLFYTGQRIGDVAKMRWTDIDEEGVLYVKQQKTGKELWIPLHERLKAILSEHERSLTTIVHKQNGKRYQTRYLSDLVSNWHGADFNTHGLRKNAVNALLDCECSIAEVQAITGQSLQMVEHYARQRKTKKSAGKAIKKWERNA